MRIVKLCVSILLIASPLVAQTILSSGIRAGGRVDTETPSVEFELSLSMGERIISYVGTRSGEPGDNLTPALKVYSPSGNLLESNVGNHDAQSSVLAPETGVYRLVVEDGARFVFGERRGNFVIEAIVLGRTLATAEGDEGGTINNGERANGSIEVGDVDTWAINVSEGDTIVAHVGELPPNDNVGIAPRVTIFAPDGSLLAQNTGNDTAEVSASASETGVYYITVEDQTSLAFEQSADYRLEVVAITQALQTATADEGGAIPNGSAVIGKIDTGDLDAWTINATEGESIIAQVGELPPNDTLGIAPKISIYSPSGMLLSAHVGNDQAEVEIVATQTGRYVITIEDQTSFSNVQQGSYRLEALAVTKPASVAQGDEGGCLISGQIVSGFIENGDIDLWTLRANKDDVVIVELGERPSEMSTDIAPKVSVYSPSGKRVVTDLGDLAAEIDFVANESGLYCIVVEDETLFANVQKGAYQMRAVCVLTGAVTGQNTGSNLTGAGTYQGDIAIGDFDYWTFDASPGSEVIVNVSELSSGPRGFAPGVTIYDPAGAVVEQGVGNDDVERRFFPSIQGTYTIVVEDGSVFDNGLFGTYELSVTGTTVRGSTRSEPTKLVARPTLIIESLPRQSKVKLLWPQEFLEDGFFPYFSPTLPFVASERLSGEASIVNGTASIEFDVRGNSKVFFRLQK